MIIFIQLLFAIVGLLMYALAANPKVQRIGETLFFCGTLAFLLRIGPDLVTLFK